MRLCQEGTRLHADDSSLDDIIERRPQAAMVFILERHEAERLQHAVERLLHRAQDFGHAVHGSSLRLERDLYKVALSERLLDSQQAASGGNGLELSFRAAAVFEPDGSQNGIAQLDSSRAPRRVRLGEVSHMLMNYRTRPCCVTGYCGPSSEFRTASLYACTRRPLF